MDGSDDDLLAELGAAVRAGQEVPDRFRQAGHAAFSWYDLDGELARLVLDSAAAPAAGLRAGGPGPRSLTFASDRLTIELDLGPDALRGQVVPSRPGVVQVRTAAGPGPQVPIDELGWFEISPVPGGPFRLSVRPDAETAVLTEWISGPP